MRDVKVLLKYHNFLKPFFLIFFISIVFDLGMTGLGLLNPLFTRILFDYAYPYHNLPLLNVALIAIIVSYFLLFFLSVASDYLQIYVNMEMTANLTSKVYHAIQCLPLKFHQEKKSGDMLVRITDDVDAAIGMVTSIIPTVLIEGGRFVIILIIALTMNPFLTFLALLSIPLYILETKFYVKRLQRVEMESIDIGSKIFTHAQERLASIKTIKAFGQEHRETLSFGGLIRESYRVGIKEKLLSVISSFTNSITLQMWSLFLTWYLGYQVVRGRLTIGEIIALMLYLEQLGGPVQAFIGLVTGWKVSMVSINRLEEVLESPSEASVDEEARAELAVPEGEIKTAKLSFSYAPEEEADVLHGIDVKFPERSLTAIVGGSGSGKTTLVNLLLRFFDASKGAIFIDGQNISEIRIRSLRKHIGLIAQDFTLFDATVLENILYGNEDKTRDDAIEAAKMASAYDFVMRFPKRFDEPVGTGGELLSGGQRQRIAIARTLLRNPEIVIFDEATSALDPESEYKIQEVMNRLARSKTVIAIAHRLSTIKTADKILVLENGRFVEEGGFDDLIEKRGAFYRFYWRQFGGLASLRQQLGMEFERAARYGSTFSVAMLRVAPYVNVLEEEGDEAAAELMKQVEFTLEKSIRMGDNCSILDEAGPSPRTTSSS
jgi:ABC-type multidrug transport system fused ATPase/permease subunit